MYLNYYYQLILVKQPIVMFSSLYSFSILSISIRDADQSCQLLGLNLSLSLIASEVSILTLSIP